MLEETLVKRREQRDIDPSEKPLNPRLRGLRTGACSLGKRWAESFRAGLRGEGRAVAGGWPGTLPEARAIVRATLSSEAARNQVSALTNDEIEWLARILYASARQDWLSLTERDTPDPSR